MVLIFYLKHFYCAAFNMGAMFAVRLFTSTSFFPAIYRRLKQSVIPLIILLFLNPISQFNIKGRTYLTAKLGSQEILSCFWISILSFPLTASYNAVLPPRNIVTYSIILLKYIIFTLIELI